MLPVVGAVLVGAGLPARGCWPRAVPGVLVLALVLLLALGLAAAAAAAGVVVVAVVVVVAATVVVSLPAELQSRY